MLCPLCHSKQLTSSRVSALSNQQLSWQHRANICCRLWSTSAELLYFICTLLYTGTTLLYSYVYSSTAVLVYWCCLAVRRILVYTRGQATTSTSLLYSCCTAVHKSTWNRVPIRMIRTLCCPRGTLHPRASGRLSTSSNRVPTASVPRFIRLSRCVSTRTSVDYIEYLRVLAIINNRNRD